MSGWNDILSSNTSDSWRTEKCHNNWYFIFKTHFLRVQKVYGQNTIVDALATYQVWSEWHRWHNTCIPQICFWQCWALEGREETKINLTHEQLSPIIVVICHLGGLRHVYSTIESQNYQAKWKIWCYIDSTRDEPEMPNSRHYSIARIIDPR